MMTREAYHIIVAYASTRGLGDAWIEAQLARGATRMTQHEFEGILRQHGIEEEGREGFRTILREGRILNDEFRHRLNTDSRYRACMDAIVEALTGTRKRRAA